MTTIEADYHDQKVLVHLKNKLFYQITKVLDPNVNYFIITDENVDALYLDTLKHQLPSSKSYTIKPGEDSKSLETVKDIINNMLNENIAKDTIMIALGGGVVGDLAGFIASIYKRGSSCIYIPTTLLSLIDSSIGGKNGINFGTFKNQVGVIKQPLAIIVDPSLLETLPPKEFKNGYAELIKYAFTLDKEHYQILSSQNYDLIDIIRWAISLKLAITCKDEFERKERKILNFGHTIGHALESITNFKLSHGEAIAIGMVYETFDLKLKEKLIQMLNLYQLPTTFIGYDINDIFTFIKADKKIEGLNLTIPVVRDLGKATLETTTLSKWKERWQ